MAKSKKRKFEKREEAKKRRFPLRVNIRFKTKNYILLALGIVSIIIGFISLARGSITLAPILLIIGYIVLIPLAILLR